MWSYGLFKQTQLEQLLENLLEKAVNLSTIHTNEQIATCQEKQIPKHIVQWSLILLLFVFYYRREYKIYEAHYIYLYLFGSLPISFLRTETDESQEFLWIFHVFEIFIMYTKKYTYAHGTLQNKKE